MKIGTSLSCSGGIVRTRHWRSLAFYSILSLVIAAIVPAFAGGDELSQAISSYNTHQYAQALGHFQNYSRTARADLCSAHYYMGLCYQGLNQLASAETEYRWVVSSGNNQALRSYAQSAIDGLSRYKDRRTYQGSNTQAQSQSQPRAGSRSTGIRLRAAGRPQVLDFTATWCGPCKLLAPILEEVESRFSGRVEFKRLDIDEPEGKELSSQLQVNAVPTLVFVDSAGQVVDRASGVLQADDLTNRVQKLIGH